MAALFCGTFLFFLALASTSFSCTTMNSNGQGFFNDKVEVRIVEGTCDHAKVNSADLLRYTGSAVNDFWNSISTSRLRFILRGLTSESSLAFTTGRLCLSEEEECDVSTVPQKVHVTVACNSNSANFNSSTYAKTQLLYGNGRIRGAVILINDTVGSPYGNLSSSQKKWILVHELGHAAGLGHSSSSESIMYYTNAVKVTALSEEDVWAMSYLYPVQQDGCGAVLSTKNSETPPSGSSLMSLILGLLIFILPSILVVLFKK
jgi:hypothetical protein